MFSIDKISRVMYHGSCHDGIMAKLSIEAVLGLRPTYVPYYFNHVTDVTIPTLFVDSHPEEDQVEGILQNGGMIIDHHDSFRAVYEKYKPLYPEQLIFGENTLGQSGAWLAMEFGHKNNVTYSELHEHLTHLVATYDTWNTSSPDWIMASKVSRYIRFVGNNFNLSMFDMTAVNVVNATLDRQDKTLTASVIPTTVTGVDEDPVTIGFINATGINEAAEDLLNRYDYDMVVGWQVKRTFDGDFKTIYSVRGNDRSKLLDVVKSLGGGGHKAAAGAQVSTEVIGELHPMIYFMNAVTNIYETLK